MTRPGKTAGVLALLIALLIGTPGLADDKGTDTPNKKTSEQEIAYLKEEIKYLKAQLDDLLRDRKLQERIAKSLESIDKSLQRLDSKPQQRSSASFDPDATTVRAGEVLLVNNLAVTAQVKINGTTYEVAPFGELPVKGLQVGSVVYTVTATGYGVTAPRRTVVRADKKLTLTIGEPN